RQLDVGRWTLDVERFLFDETKTDPRDGLHGLVPDRGCDLAARALHRRAPAPRARRLLHRRLGAASLQSGDIRSEQRIRLRGAASPATGTRIRIQESVGFLCALF